MKKIILSILLSIVTFTIISCKTSEPTEISYGAGYNVTTVKQLSIDTLTVAQVDSMIKADNLPILKKWKFTTLTDYETEKNIVYYTLIDKTTNIIYTVKLYNNYLYIVQKKNFKAKK